ncbi:NAD(P)-dependent alcohol dehydrogenase [Thalassotalea ganghwensis]
MANGGGFADYVCAKVKGIKHMPSGMNFQQAASLPQAGVIALKGIKEGRITKGQKVLINGGGGGAGSFAIQMAKFLGSEVTAVDTTSKLSFMRQMGADHVIDFRSYDFSKCETKYDFILDLAMHRSVFDYQKKLKPNGRFVVVGGSMKRIFQTVFIGGLISLFSSKRMYLLGVTVSSNDLVELESTLDACGSKPVIDRVFPFTELVEAFKYYESNTSVGKVVIRH